MNVFELIATLNLNISGYTSGLSSAKSALSGFSIFTNQAFAKIDRFAVNAFKTAINVVEGFAKSSVDAGKEFDSSMSQVAATMGKTMNEMLQETSSVDLAWGEFSGNLREYALEMGKNTAFSASQAADALNYMALAGYKVEESMNMLPNVLNLAAAGSMDLARASDMITDTQTAFGIELERTTQLVDEMAKAASTGNTSVEQLGDAFLTIGGLASELNGGLIKLSDGTTTTTDGIQELEIALTAMANAGVKGAEAGTHMRNILLKLSSPTSEGTKQLEKMGVAVFDAQGNMRALSEIFGDLSSKMQEMSQQERITAISDLFNTRDMKAVTPLLSAIQQNWNEIGESILNAQGAAQKMADTQLDNLAGDTTLFKSALEGAQVALSDALNPALRSFVQTGTRGLSALAEKLDNANFRAKLEKIGEKLGKLADKVVDFLINLDWNKILDDIAEGIDKGADAVQYLFDNSDKIIPIIKTVIAVLTAWKVIQLALNLAMLANPISLVVVAIAALIAAGVALYMNWDTVKEKAGQLWSKLRDTFNSIGASIKSTFQNAVASARSWGSDLINNFKAGITSKLSALKSTVSKAASTIKSYLHFSEPDEGPLSDFHTYAPDMMKLFAKGIADNEHLVTDQIEKSFDFGMKVSDNKVNVQRDATSEGSAGGREIILTIDGHELARFLAPAMNSQMAFGRV